MTDPVEPDPFEDLNRAVREEWRAETTPYERIREVASRTYTPIDAERLADDACTSPKTARKHLDSLADGGFVDTMTGAHGATLYRRSAESLVVEQASDVLSEVSTEELRDRIAEMRERITEYQRKYGVESPAELTVERTNELLDGSVPDGADTEESEPSGADPETVRDWETTRRNLAFANAALSIANAREFVGTDVRGNETASSS